MRIVDAGGEGMGHDGECSRPPRAAAHARARRTHPDAYNIRSRTRQDSGMYETRLHCLRLGCCTRRKHAAPSSLSRAVALISDGSLKRALLVSLYVSSAIVTQYAASSAASSPWDANASRSSFEARKRAAFISPWNYARSDEHDFPAGRREVPTRARAEWLTSTRDPQGAECRENTLFVRRIVARDENWQ